jgi:UDP-N-acetylmuramate: L-alanyl-gamma-D-glutamyl-meso-diaminopimelate ligase
LSPDRVAAGIQAGGKPARTFDDVAEIVEYIAAGARPGDHVVIMSNGGFDNIHQRLLERLRER